ncbi:DUF6220 domain-containing protein [Sphaerobacter thermophilus]|uniref:DUF6220 domain-containing protein n=1 Tax=Sphaerobacter thermophilus TaxID=2057 RepID=UPI0039C14DE8
MQMALARAHQIVAWFTVVGILLQIYLAGGGSFGAVSYDLHRAWGNLLGLPILVLPILALAGRIGRRGIGLTMLLLGLYIVQMALPSLRVGLPYIAAFHVLNATALVGVAAATGRASGAAIAAQRRTPVLTTTSAGSEHGA